MYRRDGTIVNWNQFFEMKVKILDFREYPSFSRSNKGEKYCARIELGEIITRIFNKFSYKVVHFYFLCNSYAIRPSTSFLYLWGSANIVKNL